MPAPALQIEDTPNPHAMKFIAEQPLPPLNAGEEPAARPRGIRSYRSVADAEAAGDELALAVFQLKPVVSVMIAERFVTVNKKPSARWKQLTPRIEAALQPFLES